MSLDKTAARHLTEQQTAPGKCCRGLPASECAYVPDRECALKAAAAPADAERLALAERIENDVLLPMRLYGLTNCGRILTNNEWQLIVSSLRAGGWREDMETKLRCAESLISRIEAMIPNWKAYRDLAEAVEVTLHHARQR